jgi:hypothetical protein
MRDDGTQLSKTSLRIVFKERVERKKDIKAKDESSRRPLSV